MSVTGLLQVFDELPAYSRLQAALAEKQPIPALQLPPSGRAAVLARLYMELRVPIVLLTGKVESASSWVQALSMWLPEGDVMHRMPEPTPLPYERGPWSARCIRPSRRLHPLIGRSTSTDART